MSKIDVVEALREAGAPAESPGTEKPGAGKPGAGKSAG